MTVTQESLREALDYIADAKFTNDQRLIDICATARFVERLLPAACLCRGYGLMYEGDNSEPQPCPHCHSTGQLWDEGLVEVVRKAILDFDRSGSPYPSKDGLARAVLSALAQKVGK